MGSIPTTSTNTKRPPSGGFLGLVGSGWEEKPRSEFTNRQDSRFGRTQCARRARAMDGPSPFRHLHQLQALVLGVERQIMGDGAALPVVGRYKHAIAAGETWNPELNSRRSLAYFNHVRK